MLKTTFRVVSILIFMLYLISCKESEEVTIPVKKLAKKASFFNDSNDEFFLVNPSDMFQLKDKVFIAEAELSHLAIFDLNFKFIQTVGRFGEGPDDFFYLGKMGKTPDGLLYLHDRGHELLRLFDSDGVEKKRISVFMKPDQVSMAIGKGGFNIRLASRLVGYEIDVFRELSEIEDEEDVVLDEFGDEIEDWVIDELKKTGLDTAKSVLSLTKEDLLRRTELEEETIDEIFRILKQEFEQ